MAVETEMKTQEDNSVFQWQWNWKILLFSLFFFPLTMRLGFWQLERGEEKQGMLSVHQQRAAASRVDVSKLQQAEDRQYVKVFVAGVFDNSTTLLLDNRVRGGRPGYEVISVFRPVGQPALLVNRGWIEGNLNRAILPVVPLIENEVTLTGYLYQSPGQQFMLGSDLWDADKPLQIVQNAAPEIVAERLGEPFYDYMLRLDKDAVGAFDSTWHIVNVQPEKHLGYAVQWFVMAAVLVLLTVLANSNLTMLWRSRRRKENRSDIDSG